MLLFPFFSRYITYRYIPLTDKDLKLLGDHIGKPDCVHAQKQKSEQLQQQLRIRWVGVWMAFFGNSVSSVSLKSPNMLLKCIHR